MGESSFRVDNIQIEYWEEIRMEIDRLYSIFHFILCSCFTNRVNAPKICSKIFNLFFKIRVEFCNKSLYL